MRCGPDVSCPTRNEERRGDHDLCSRVALERRSLSSRLFPNAASVARSLQDPVLASPGAKTVETRNTRLFEPLEGRTVCVRIGKKDWPNEEWRDVHDATTAQLPRGFRRGDVAGTCVIGATDLISTFERVLSDACAPLEACGKFGTRVADARWFPTPLRNAPGAPGIYDIRVPKKLLPASLRLDSEAPPQEPGSNARTPPPNDPPPPKAPGGPGPNRRARRNNKPRVQSGALAVAPPPPPPSSK